jgi:hypothetical protein
MARDKLNYEPFRFRPGWLALPEHLSLPNTTHDLMNAPSLLILAGTSLLATPTWGQGVLFDFENAPLHSGLPLALTVGGITAQFSATGQGFSIQEAGTMGFTPVGFSGYCIYPSSVFLADLLVGFSVNLTNFSILYAPQELACDSSARMRVTAYLDNALVGTSTTTADPPGTWPSATLSFSSAQLFNRVVVHYDAPPPTGGDWGPIFLADNMTVTPGPPTLRVFLANTNAVALAWPVAATGFTLQEKAGLGNAGWSDVTTIVTVIGNENQVVIGPSADRQFYRLCHP